MRFVINQMATKWQRAAACSTSQEQFQRTLRITVEREIDGMKRKQKQ